MKEAYTGPRVMIHSGEFNGMDHEEGIAAVTKYLEKSGFGKNNAISIEGLVDFEAKILGNSYSNRLL